MLIKVRNELRFLVQCVLTGGGQLLSVMDKMMPGQGTNKIDLA
jgi:hypothetical protein